jgi:transposase
MLSRMLSLVHASSGTGPSSATNTTNTTNALPIYLIVQPVDMRLGIDGLSACVEHRLKHSPSPCAGGGLYVFSNARRNRIKLLLWDATGVWLAQRRLHQGRFTWCDAGDAGQGTDTTRYAINAPCWEALTMGLDWPRLTQSAEAHQHWRVG